MKVSLVTTVLDIGPAHAAEFLASLAAQTRRPDEVIVVDGGSVDGTREAFEASGRVTVLVEPGAGISRGRNVGIRAAAHDVLALTDADCVLDPTWLERVVAPIEAGADVAAGFYRPVAATFLQECAAATAVPEPDEVRPGWMPSSRSIAFRRAAWEATGGYPEWLAVGEDMYFNHRLRETGQRTELAVDAVVGWRVRPTLGATWRQYARYAEGDAAAGMYPERHALRAATYLAAGIALRSRHPVLLALAAAGAVAYAGRPVRRALRRLPDPLERAAALAAVPTAMAFVDAAKLWGYGRGLARRLLAPRPRPAAAPQALRPLPPPG